VTRVDPWSAMKFSFVISLVFFVVLFVAVLILWGILARAGVFDAVSSTVQDLTTADQGGGLNVSPWFTASRVMKYTVMLGGVNVVLFTALGTIGAFVYNIAAGLVGGVEVTLAERE
jgi:hypothetical protein